MIEPILTPEQYAQVKAYVGPIYAATWLGPACTLVTYACFLRWLVAPLYALSGRWAQRLGEAFGFLRRTPVVRAALAAMDKIWRGPGWGQAVLFAACFFVVDELSALPFGIYFGFLHEKAFGLTSQSASTFAFEVVKSDLVALTAHSMLALGMFGLARRFRRWWLLLGTVAAVAMVGSQALDPYRSQLSFDDTPLPKGQVRTDLENLLHRAGVQFGDIYVENTSRLSNRVDVSCSGSGPTARVVINDRFLEQFPERELLVAVAHEAGHVHEGNAWGIVGAGVALIAFLFLVDRLFALAARRGWLGIREIGDVRALPFLSLLFFGLQLLTTPISAAYSRHREQEADRFALEQTHDVDAFESLIIRAARINKSDPDPPAWYVWRLSAHPPVRDRLEWAERQKKTAGW